MLARRPDGDARSLGYVPALDGVRAFAVLAVVLFHAGFGWASGGFVGVSVFFTLSGFLITSLLLAEHARDRRVSLRRFYGRRVRRLLPASYLGIALVVASIPWWSQVQRRRLPGDVLAAVGNFYNWRAAWSSISYRELFDSAPSPLAHFWSLAIEEQCYLVLPIITVLVLRAGGTRWLTAVASALLAGTAVAAFLTTDFDLGYNATYIRGGEVLLGLVLATVLRGRRPDGVWSGILGLLGLGGLTLAILWVDLGDQWLARGGLLGVAVLSVGLIVGVQGSGPLARAFASRPLVALGRVSYGVYLFHWPVFQLLTPERTGLDRWPLLAVRGALTAALTMASYHLLECPIRERRWLVSRGRGLVVLAVSASTLLVGVWVVPVPPLSETEQLLAGADGGPVLLPPATTDAAEGDQGIPPEPPRVLVLGSEPSGATALLQSGLDVEVVNHVREGCPVASGVEVQLTDGQVLPIEQCAPSGPMWVTDIAQTAPDLVVLSFGPLDDGLIRTDADAQFPPLDDGSARYSMFSKAEHEIAEWLQQFGNIPIVLYWPTDRPSSVGAFRDFSIYATRARGPYADAASLSAAVDEELSIGGSRRRVLVIGDSTSYGFAIALSRSSTELEVQWAGKGGCPFVPVEALQTTEGGAWGHQGCPDYRVLVPDLLATFDADAVLIIVGGMELTVQRYPGDAAGYEPGSQGYQLAHDAAMTDLLSVLGPDGPLVVVADAPPIHVGPFSSLDMSRADRLAALNAQIRRWSDQHPGRVEVVSYVAPLLAYESEHGSIRPDGSHADPDLLVPVLKNSVAPSLVEMIDAAR